MLGLKSQEASELYALLNICILCTSPSGSLNMYVNPSVVMTPPLSFNKISDGMAIILL